MGEVISRTSVVLWALLLLTIAACTEAGPSTASTDPTATGPGRDTTIASPTTRQSISIPATTKTIPEAVATETSGIKVTRPSVVPTVTTSPLPAGTAGPADPQSTSAPALSADALIDKDCTAGNSDIAYDLLHVKVEPVASRYRLTAQYTGDTFQHDILISFDLGRSTYLVNAELFEDGKGVGRVASIGSSEDIFLDPPQTISSGVVDLTVRDDQIGGLSGTSFDVEVVFKVDGSEIETCR